MKSYIFPMLTYTCALLSGRLFLLWALEPRFGICRPQDPTPLPNIPPLGHLLRSGTCRFEALRAPGVQALQADGFKTYKNL